MQVVDLPKGKSSIRIEIGTRLKPNISWFIQELSVNAWAIIRSLVLLNQYQVF